MRPNLAVKEATPPPQMESPHLTPQVLPQGAVGHGTPGAVRVRISLGNAQGGDELQAGPGPVSDGGPGTALASSAIQQSPRTPRAVRPSRYAAGLPELGANGWI